MNFRVRMVHDFSAILTEVPDCDARCCGGAREEEPGEAAAGGVM